jgi:hypothetical protein
VCRQGMLEYVMQVVAYGRRHRKRHFVAPWEPSLGRA